MSSKGFSGAFLRWLLVYSSLLLLQLLILTSISSSSCCCCCWAWMISPPHPLLLPSSSSKGIIHQQQQHDDDDDDCKKTSTRLFVASSDDDVSSSSSSSSSPDNNNNNNNDSLTLKELGTRLQMVRQQVRNEYQYQDEDEDESSSSSNNDEAIMAQLEICDELLCTRFRNLNLSRCIVQSSSIHGRGLFATRQIFKDELITCYPGDALLAWPNNGNNGLPGPIGCQLQAMYGPHITQEEQLSSDFFLLHPKSRDYEVVTGKYRSIVGDPSRSSDSAYLGHFCNDCCCDKVDDEKYYNQKSLDGAINAAHMILERCHFVTVATRTIEIGEEIFVSYGEGYWKGRRQKKENKKKKATPSRGGFGKKNKK